MLKKAMDTNETATANADALAVLRDKFAGCFTKEGAFDLKAFAVRIRDQIAVTEEGYQLDFLGKNYARLLANEETETVIVPDTEHNAKPENAKSQNVYISGDNLDALKHLLKSYEHEVKCIYIDPPYNTGTDGFVYNDNFKFKAEELARKLSITDEEAKKLLDFVGRGSASHSAWLMFMYPRLQLAKTLLRDDGIIFISIDDNEQANLKLLCDDIFGEQNFLAEIIVQSNKRGQTYKQLAKTHEYLLVYAKSEAGLLQELCKQEGTFSSRDDVGEFDERELRNRNPKYGRFNRPNLFYPIYANPDKEDSCGYYPVSLVRSEEFSVEILPRNSEGEDSCWRWGMRKFEANNADDSMISNVVAKKKSTGEFGCYEKYRKDTFKAKTIWYDEFINGDLVDDEDIWDETSVITEQGSKELRTLGMGDAFDFPKPIALLEKVISIGLPEKAICVDFFSGSGTTFEAVLRAQGDRHIIAVQLPEDLDHKLAKAAKTDRSRIKKVIDFLNSVNRPHTLDQVGLERIQRALLRIKDASPLLAKTMDLGFKHFTLARPSGEVLEKIESFDPKASMLATQDMLNEFGVGTVLATWMNHDGYGLTRDAEKIDLAGYAAYRCDHHLYLVNANFGAKQVKALLEKYETDAAFTPDKIVLFGYSFGWKELEELDTNLKKLKTTHNITTDLDIRY